MQHRLIYALTATLTLAISLGAQPAPRAPRGGSNAAGMSGGPKFDPAFRKLFGEHKAWSSGLEINVTNTRAGGPVTIQATLAMLEDKSRMDMDLTKMQGGGMQPGMAAQIKAMGMAEIFTITRPDKKVNYMVYPGLEGYVEVPLPEGSDAAVDKFKLQVTEQGKETIDGHPCVKNKFTITDDSGKPREGTVWQASDLKNFPLRIEALEDGQTVTMNFKDVKFAAPAAAQFEPPGKFKKYANQQAMMQEVMMKRFSGGAGGIPLPPPPNK